MGLLSKLFGSKAAEPAPVPARRPVADVIYDFRHIKDVNNIVPYETCSSQLQVRFENFFDAHLAGYDVQSRVEASDVFAGAPDYAMPLNFVISKGGRTLAVLLVEQSYMRRYSFLETQELCKENGLGLMFFYMQLPNEEEYVIERVKAYFL
jgi:hypothetical protein